MRTSAQKLADYLDARIATITQELIEKESALSETSSIRSVLRSIMEQTDDSK